jgi:alkylated DNA repair dioxygenase AlkB
MHRQNLLPKDGDAFLYEEFFSAEESQYFFQTLLNEIAWVQEPIKIFGKMIMQPRLTAWYGDSGLPYTYSGITMSAKPWTTSLLEIKNRIENVSGAHFNSVLLNQYRNERDSMGWHRDNERELGVNPTIGSVSFGATREFQFRHCADKSLRVSLPLVNGSFLLMSGRTQHHWLHCVPKRAKSSAIRINLTFRQILR